MKRKMILSIIASIGLAAMLTGCGGGNGNSDSNSTTVSKTATKVTASDAYVVELNTPAKLTLNNGKVYTTTKVDSNGTIVFNIPKGTNLTNATVYVPGDAIVDTDGDGKLSAADQIIRTPLLTKYIKEGNTISKNIIANPSTTAVLLKDPNLVNPNSLKNLKIFIKEDPVKLKKEAAQKMIQEVLQGKTASVEQLKPLKQAAFNDGMAYIYKTVEKISDKLNNYNIKMNKKQEVDTIMKSIDITNLSTEVNNDNVPYDTFITDLKTQIENGVANLKTNINKEYSTNLTQNELQEVDQDLTKQVNQIDKKLLAEKEILTKIKQKLMEQENNIGKESMAKKEKLTNELVGKITKMLIVSSDTEIDSSDITNEIGKSKNLTDINFTNIIKDVPKNQIVINRIKEHLKEMKEETNERQQEMNNYENIPGVTINKNNNNNVTINKNNNNKAVSQLPDFNNEEQ